MGQKVNPHGLRVGVIKDWDSRWYARADKVGDLVVEDYNIRKYLKNKLYSAGIAKIEVERNNAKIKINIHCARPGVVIGKAGAEIENLRQDMEKRLGKKVNLNIVEVRSPDLNAQLVQTGRRCEGPRILERPSIPVLAPLVSQAIPESSPGLSGLCGPSAGLSGAPGSTGSPALPTAGCSGSRVCRHAVLSGLRAGPRGPGPYFAATAVPFGTLDLPDGCLG